MFYTVYKITNKVNNKIYIGCHKTDNLYDEYLGSGKLLNYAKEKYGIENFVKEYIEIFDNEEDMFLLESKLVNEEFVKRKDTYNIKQGGFGGFDYINNNKLNISDNQKKAAKYYRGVVLNQKKSWLLKNDPEWRKKYLTNLSKSLKGRKATFKGKQHSEETKKLMSESAKGKHIGEKNSQFGTMWITNGIQNKKMSKDLPIPEGWYKGRI